MSRNTSEDDLAPRSRLPLSAWRFVTTFGTISLLADFVYEGARSITGPLLASLGATGLVVGLVTGVGEAAALALRLVSGPLTDRTQRFWAWAIAGYVLTVVTVPVLGIAATLWAASALVIAERIGKAVRSPAKDTMLSHAAAATGRGRGFAVHEALDQIGAVVGPLTVAGVLELTGNNYGPALGVLAFPGVGALALLVWLRLRVPDPARYELYVHSPSSTGNSEVSRSLTSRLNPSFWAYCGFTATTMVGFATFGVLSFHMVTRGILSAAAVPIVYALAMTADALAALVSGSIYDRHGAKTLAALPLLSALTVTFVFGDHLWLIVIGALLWGAAVGFQESTMRAVVADLVPMSRRATGYGIFAAVMGVATAIGGALTGWLYDTSVSVLIASVVAVQLVAACLAITATQIERRRQTSGRKP